MGTQLNTVLRLSLLIGCVTLASACDRQPFEPVGRRPVGGLEAGGGGGPSVVTLEGTWQRTLAFFDDFGFLHSSETTWTFGQNGLATRTTVTTNVTLGVADTAVTTAEWRVEGTRVVIDFLAPSPGTITLDFVVQGTKLFLAGQEYQRIT